MDIPSLPTDNLYKFSALSGLLLVVFGLGYPSSKVFEIQLYQNEVGTDVQAATQRAEAFERLAKRLADNQDRTAVQIERYESARDAGLEQAAILTHKGKRIDILLEQAKFYLIFGFALASFGLVFSFWGFSNWLRLQRITDSALLSQRPSMSDGQNTPKPSD